MHFEWDDQKNRSNLRKHGLSFANAARIFDLPMLVDQDDRFEYGEDRWVGVGRLGDLVVVIVYTEPDDETIRIVSLRKALSHEREIYEDIFGRK